MDIFVVARQRLGQRPDAQRPLSAERAKQAPAGRSQNPEQCFQVVKGQNFPRLWDFAALDFAPNFNEPPTRLLQIADPDPNFFSHRSYSFLLGRLRKNLE
jgi:hypothetical protein